MEILKPPTYFEDHRGIYVETWNSDQFGDWVQDCTSISHKHVLRGLHGDWRGCYKLVTCLYGEIFVAAVHPKLGTVNTAVLSKPDKQLLIHRDYALGHVVLSDVAVFNYKQDQPYDRSVQFTIKWDDPKYGIEWPVTDPILSERDTHGPFVGERR